MSTAALVIVVGARFLVPLPALRFPLPAMLAALVIDAVDQTVLDALLGEPMSAYQSYDKALDVHYLTIAYFATLRNWRHGFAFRCARALYLFRLVGVFLFELTDRRWLLLAFANVFEFGFLAYEAVATRWDPRRLPDRVVVATVAFVWLFVKLPQEWWLHVARRDLTDTLAQQPWAWVVVLVAMAGPVVVAWTLRHRVPPPDRSFAVDVDRRQAPPDLTDAAEHRFWSAVLAEKVVLLVLISQIFANVLPDVEARNTGLAVGVGILVVLNAAVTHQVRRSRGRGWAGVGQAFLAMLVINGGLALIDAVTGRRRVADLPASSTMFFVVMLSLLIALYDRYRTARSVSRRRHRHGPPAPAAAAPPAHPTPHAASTGDGNGDQRQYPAGDE